MIRAALLLALSLLAGIALGADADTPPWYDVELIVFKNKAPPTQNGELWPVDPGTPELAQTTELAPPAGGTQPFQQLGASSHTLGSALTRLSASRDYRPLLHLAWRQPVTAQADAPAVHVYGGGNGAEGGEAGDATPAREIDGAVRVSRNRFLHVDVDLLLRENGPTDAGRTFRLRQSRRVSSGELHYFDHPAFGVLVKLTPYEPPGQKNARPSTP
ncbi:MAG: peptidoglycan binding protein CsiV [Gammaproteobacteria bacterium]|nr:peptidoglycan binding protein CsiV [Gammaproteobacteria bacterium]